MHEKFSGAHAEDTWGCFCPFLHLSHIVISSHTSTLAIETTVTLETFKRSPGPPLHTAVGWFVQALGRTLQQQW